MNDFYYQPPNINDPNGYGQPVSENAAAMRNMYFIEKARLERKQIRKLGNIVGLAMTAYIFVQLAASFVLGIKGIYDLYMSSPIFQICINILAIEVCAVAVPFGVMALLNKNKYESDLIPTEKISAGKVVVWVGFGMICCVLADYVVGFMMTIFNSFGHELVQPETAPPNTLFACIISFVGTAIVPALCEEFALRCCSLGLLKKYGKAFGVVCVALVFGVLHGNLIQLVFATLVGLIMGFVTVKTNSIIPAVLIHLFNNGMAAIGEIIVYFFGDEADNYATVAMFGFWFVFGLICTFILAVKGELRKNYQNVQFVPFENSLAKKVATFFFVPGMIIPAIFFVVMTFASIQ